MSEIQPTRVLIVDDEESTRYVLRKHLQPKGYEILEAGLGKEGLKILEKTPVDVVVVDVHLPDVSGYEICRKIKATPGLRQLPVIQMSATFTSSEDRAVALEHGADACLTQPFEPRELLAQMESLLRERRIEQALRERDATLRLSVETAALGCYSRDLITNVVTMDERCRTILGVMDRVVDSEVAPRSLFPDDRERILALVKRAFDPSLQEICGADFRIVRPTGEVRWVAGRGRVVFDQTATPPRPLKFIGVLQDITERKSVEEALRESEGKLTQARDELARVNAELEARVLERTRSLEQTTRELNDFCYSIAHDLRAPIRAQTAFAHVLAQEFGDVLGETGRHYVGIIEGAAQRQGKLLSDLLTHISVGQAEMPLQSLDLAALTSAARADLEGEINEKQATVDCAAVNGKVLGNEASLHLAITNLLTNALKFVPADRKPVIRMRTEPKGSYLRLWVEDNGIGIPVEHRDKLFGVFQRLHSAEKYPGTGIGLAIVKRAIERMGGTVGLESSVGVGSGFWVDLRPAPAG